jgi:hypothetical protein
LCTISGWAKQKAKRATAKAAAHRVRQSKFEHFFKRMQSMILFRLFLITILLVPPALLASNFVSISLSASTTDNSITLYDNGFTNFTRNALGPCFAMKAGHLFHNNANIHLSYTFNRSHSELLEARIQSTNSRGEEIPGEYLEIMDTSSYTSHSFLFFAGYAFSTISPKFTYTPSIGIGYSTMSANARVYLSLSQSGYFETYSTPKFSYDGIMVAWSNALSYKISGNFSLSATMEFSGVKSLKANYRSNQTNPPMHLDDPFSQKDVKINSMITKIGLEATYCFQK